MIRTCVEFPFLAQPYSRPTTCLDPMERPISIGDHCYRKSGFRESAQTRDPRNANTHFGTSESAEEKRINEKKRKFNGMRQTRGIRNCVQFYF